MAITSTLLTGSFSTASSTAFITSSAAPSSAANSMVLAAVLHRQNTTQASVAPTVQGWGLTWTQIDSIGLQQGGNGSRRLSLFHSSGTAVPGGKSTIHFSGTTNTQGILWAFIGLGGVDTASGIVQSNSNQSTVAQAGWSVALGAVSTANASFGTFASVCNTAVSTGSGYAVVYANSTFTVTSTNFTMNFFNEIASTANSNVACVECNNAMNQGIAIEIAAHQTPNPIAHLSAAARLSATISPNDRLQVSIAAVALLSATLTRNHLNTLTAALNASASLTATLTVGRVTRELQTTIQASAALVPAPVITGPGPAQVGRGATTKQYALAAKIQITTDGYPPMSRTKTFASTMAPRIKQSLLVSTSPTGVDLTSVSNARFLLVVPDTTNTVPIHLAYQESDTEGIVLSSADASFFAIGAPTTGFNLFTTDQQTNVRVGIY